MQRVITLAAFSADECHGHPLCQSTPPGSPGSDVPPLRAIDKHQGEGGQAANPDYAHLQDYTDLPMPDWNTPLKCCTAQGAVLIERESQKLKQKEPKMEVSKLRVLVDTVQRDATTANSLLQGLANVEYYPLLFHAVHPNTGAGVCRGPDTQLVTAQRQQRPDATPVPMGVGPGPAHSMNQTRYGEVLDLFENLFGIGATGPLKNLTNPPVIDNKTGELMGAAIVLKRLATNLVFCLRIRHSPPDSCTGKPEADNRACFLDRLAAQGHRSACFSHPAESLRCSLYHYSVAGYSPVLFDGSPKRIYRPVSRPSLSNSY